MIRPPSVREHGPCGERAAPGRCRSILVHKRDIIQYIIESALDMVVRQCLEGRFGGAGANFPVITSRILTILFIVDSPAGFPYTH